MKSKILIENVGFSLHILQEKRFIFEAGALLGVWWVLHAEVLKWVGEILIIVILY